MTDIAELGLYVDSKGVMVAQKRLKGLEHQAGRTERKTDGLSNKTKRLTVNYSLLATAITSIGFVALTKKVIGHIDAYQGLSNKLKLVTEDSKNLADTQERLFDIAQNSRGSLEATVDLYFRLAKSTTELNVSQTRLAKVTETVNKAVAISGTTQQAASAALFQMGQGMAAGALRGQELNSVLEQIPRVAQAIADGMGVPVGGLRELAEQGLITSETIIQAFESQAETINAEFNATEKTISQAMTQIQNQTLKTFGSIEGGELVKALDGLRETLSDPAVVQGLQNLAAGAVSAAAAAAKAGSGVGAFASGLGEWTAAYKSGDIDLFEYMTASIDEASDKLTALAAKREWQQITGGFRPDFSAFQNSEEKKGGSDSALKKETDNMPELLAMQKGFLALHNEERLLAIQTAAEEEANLKRMAHAQMLLDQQAYNESVLAAEELMTKAKLQISASAFGNLAVLMSSGSKKVFAIGKAAAMASATISGIAAAQDAFKAGMSIGGPSAPLFAKSYMASSYIATGANLAAIAKAKPPSGQAHAGMDNVPREGSYNLQKGEMVLDPGTSEKVRNNAIGGGGNFTFNMQMLDIDDAENKKEKLFEWMWNSFIEKRNEEGLPA